MSPKSPSKGDDGKNMETLETSKKQCLHGKPIEIIDNGDNGDNGDIIPEVVGKKNPLYDFNNVPAIKKINPMFDFNLRTMPVEKTVDWSF